MTSSRHYPLHLIEKNTPQHQDLDFHAPLTVHHEDASLPGAVKIPNGTYASQGVQFGNAALAPAAVYTGGFTGVAAIEIRIANGGAGQSGLIGAWANAFIKYSVSQGAQPFFIAWYLGDTTESLALLKEGSVDIAVTYNEAAEQQSLDSGAAVKRYYGFRDHFLLVGPKANPATLNSEKDDILTMFNKIVTQGNADAVVPPDPNKRPATRFLSRYDKSATNIKDSELFIKIGQVPWGLAYSKWYHQYPQFPLQALKAAAVLDEYTVTDRGTWLSSSSQVTSSIAIYKAGTDAADDLLLNPGRVLLGAKVDAKYQKVCEQFMEWIIRADGGQKVVREFKKNGEVLYSEAPKQ